MFLVIFIVSKARSGSYGTSFTFSCVIVPFSCIIRTPILDNFVPVWAKVTFLEFLSGEFRLYTLWLCPSIKALIFWIFLITPALVFSSKASP